MLYIGRVLFLRRRFGILQRQRRAEAQNRLSSQKKRKMFLKRVKSCGDIIIRNMRAVAKLEAI